MSELTPELLVNLITAVILAGTVGFMIWGIYYQRKQLHQDAYSVLRESHADIVKLQIEQNDDLHDIWYKIDKPVKIDETNWTKERKIFLFYILVFDLYERLHWQIMHGEILDNQQIRDEEWEYWLNWLGKIKNHWLFEYTFDKVHGAYYKEFVDNISKKYSLKIDDSS